MDCGLPVVQNERQPTRDSSAAHAPPAVQEYGVQQISEIAAPEAEDVRARGIVRDVLKQVRRRRVSCRGGRIAVKVPC